MPDKDNIPDRNQLLWQWITRATVPHGLRPTAPQEIEALLDTIGGEPLSDGQLQRILSKAKGDIPIGIRVGVKISITNNHAFVETQSELLALHKNQGEKLAPEIDARLDALRTQARNTNDKGLSNGLAQ